MSKVPVAEDSHARGPRFIISVEGAAPSPNEPRGVVLAFLQAAAREDEEGLREHMTASCRDGASIGSAPEGERFTVGAEQRDGDLALVAFGVDGAPPVQMVLVQEDGWKLDMEQTAKRILGFDPQELLEGMGQAMAEGFEQMGKALSEGFGSKIQPEEFGDPDDPVDLEGVDAPRRG